MKFWALWMSLVLVISTGVQAQTSCSEDCAEAIGCYGGCTIVLTEGCGGICSSSGCKVTCKETGSPTSCTASETVNCEKRSGGPPKTSRTGPAEKLGVGQWALVRRPALVDKSLKVEHIPVVAASTPEFGSYAAGELLQKLTEDTAVRSQAQPVRPRKPGPIDPREERLPELFVAPGTGHCVKPTVDLVKKVFPFEVEHTIGGYIRGVTDGSGVVASLEILYTRDPEWNDELVQYALDNLRVWSPEAAGVPLEFYGSLSVAKTRAVGYIIGGVFAPPDFWPGR